MLSLHVFVHVPGLHVFVHAPPVCGCGGGGEGEGGGGEGEGGEGDSDGGGGEGGGGDGGGEGGGGEGLGGGCVLPHGMASQKVVATARLRIERVQGGVRGCCRKAIRLIAADVLAPEDRILAEASEVGLTQSEHFRVVKL